MNDRAKRLLLAASLSAVNLMASIPDAWAWSLQPLRQALMRESRAAVNRERMKQSVARDLERL